MRLSETATPTVDALLTGLARGLNADDPRRAASLESARRWLAAALPSSLPAAGTGVDSASAEDAAEALVRHRLELLVGELLPAARECGADRDAPLHVRPLRSRLHAALTLPADGGSLIVVDDAVHDLTMSLATWITASWAPPGTDPTAVARPPVPLFDAVRVFRAELGAVRWNGALWQPVVVSLADESRRFAAVLGELALKFVLAHEIGHFALGHHRREERDEVASRAHELEADAFAARVLRRHLEESAADDARAVEELGGLARAAVRVALGALEAVSAVFLVRGDEHPPADLRFAAACEACGLDGDEVGLERPVTTFFQHLEGLVTSGIPTLVEVVDRSDSMRFARDYDEAERLELDRIDRAEVLFHTPLPALLEAMAEAALPGGEPRPPREVIDAARRADALNAGPRTSPVPTPVWIRLAAGRWWLLERLLGARDEAEIEATLHPRPGTRFRDWAGWVERDCPEEMAAVALAALHVYATAGLHAEGPALEESGLPKAVGAWLEPGVQR